MTASFLQALPQAFFVQDTVTVAWSLLGCRLVWKDPKAGIHYSFKIVETEAYTQDDPACHAYQRKAGKITPRAQTLYKAPGLAYVYLTYGMHHCLNVVTEPDGIAGAVLFRGLEPLDHACSDFNTCGPGCLTRALGINRLLHNEIDLTDPASAFFLASGEAVAETQIVAGPRIGISQAMDWPWRFYIAGNRWVSRLPKKLSV